jgi:hypothetical protein
MYPPHLGGVPPLQLDGGLVAPFGYALKAGAKCTGPGKAPYPWGSERVTDVAAPPYYPESH